MLTLIPMANRWKGVGSMCYTCWRRRGKPRKVNKQVGRAAKLINAVYKAGCSTGGALHIVIDDWNLGKYSLKFCERQMRSPEFREDYTERQRKAQWSCLRALKRMSEYRRGAAMALADGFIDEAGKEPPLAESGQAGPVEIEVPVLLGSSATSYERMIVEKMNVLCNPFEALTREKVMQAQETAKQMCLRGMDFQCTRCGKQVEQSFPFLDPAAQLNLLSAEKTYICQACYLKPLTGRPGGGLI